MDERADVEQQRVLLEAADDRRAAVRDEGAVAIERVALAERDAHGECGDVAHGQGAAARARDLVDDVDVGGVNGQSGDDRLRKRLRAGAQLLRRGGEHAQGGDLGERSLWLEVDAQRLLERGERHLVEADGACEGVRLEAVDQLLLADDDARLGSAEQLVARERDEIAAFAQRLLDGRLGVLAEAGETDERAGSLVLVHEQAGILALVADTAHRRRALRTLRGAQAVLLVGHRAQLLDRDGLGEARHAVVGGMHLEEHRGVLGDGPRVIAWMRLVGGAHLHHARA